MMGYPRKMRRTRIVATLGPATDRPGMLARILDAGVNVVRLNMSHGTHDDHARRISEVRALAGPIEVAILADLQGPKIRVGLLPQGGVILTEGDKFVLTNRDVISGTGIATLDYPPLPSEVSVGARILLDDGNLQLQVDATDRSDISCTVVRGGRLTSHKGINVPGAPLSAPALTDKDLDDAVFAAGLGGGFAPDACGIIAKIERPEALEVISEILAEADGIMVARGDLGVEIPLERVPQAQKRLLDQCNQAAKPAITATQMLESMINQARPTRAEATDVHVAVTELTDAVMLSGETAAGKFPLEAVQAMAAISHAAEQVVTDADHSLNARRDKARTATEAVAQAVVEIAMELGARAIVTATSSGGTPRLVAKYRPQAPILALSSHLGVLRRLLLTWGVTPVLAPPFTSTDELFRHAVQATVELGIAKEGDLIVITAGVPLGVTGRTNLIKVHRIGEPLPGSH
ncbi:MAG: pyruvate kinase [Chloroflexi bacterium]|nr:pyruvate kinase [Chloroflexota bacterium]